MKVDSSSSFPARPGQDRRSLIPLAKNALRKLRTLRHPDVLKFLDGSETDTSVWIITERIEPLSLRIGAEGDSILDSGLSDEWKIWGLCRLSVRCGFLYFILLSPFPRR